MECGMHRHIKTKWFGQWAIKKNNFLDCHSAHEDDDGANAETDSVGADDEAPIPLLLATFINAANRAVFLFDPILLSLSGRSCDSFAACNFSSVISRFSFFSSSCKSWISICWFFSLICCLATLSFMRKFESW